MGYVFGVFVCGGCIGVWFDISVVKFGYLWSCWNWFSGFSNVFVIVWVVV